MRIAVIGGGLFGCTAAIYAARAGHEVHLFERGPRLMGCASAVNQFRLHRGYHYPRSPETGRQCRAGNISFMREYGLAVLTPQARKWGQQVYAIARDGSKVSGAEFRAFMDANGLPYREWPTGGFLNAQTVETCFRVLESAIDPKRLTELVRAKLDVSGVNVHLGTEANACLRSKFDRIIIAAYAGTNEVARTLGCKTQDWQFEVVEKPVIDLGGKLEKTSIVVMDGEFCSIDPYGSTGLHLLGHVKYAIHHRNVGTSPEIPEHIKGFLNAGIVKPPFRRHSLTMIEAASEFVPALADAHHVGSMFTVRAVLPNVDATDERPTLVQRLDDQVIRIFSGKLGTAVDAATEALFMMERKKEAA